MISINFKLETISQLSIEVETAKFLTLSKLIINSGKPIIITKSELLELSEFFKLAAENTKETQQDLLEEAICKQD